MHSKKTGMYVVFVFISSLFLNACGETVAVINCAQPISVELSEGVSIGGSYSIKEAKGEIDSSIGRDLKTKFSTSSSSDWLDISKTYQYQMCQFVNTVTCDDLSKSECISRKQNIYNDAFQKIQDILREERDRERREAEEKVKRQEVEAERKRQEVEVERKRKEVKVERKRKEVEAERKRKEAEVARKRQEVAAESLRQSKIASCVSLKIQKYEENLTTSVTGGARAPGPGWKGGRKKSEEYLCHKVGANQVVISSSTKNTCCHGGRCSVSAPSTSENNTKACVLTKAWSESKSYGGGGCGFYRLTVVYKSIIDEVKKSNFRNLCITSI